MQKKKQTNKQTNTQKQNKILLNMQILLNELLNEKLLFDQIECIVFFLLTLIITLFVFMSINI